MGESTERRVGPIFGALMVVMLLASIDQGIGGGALMVTTQAVIGDVVSPRERGPRLLTPAGTGAADRLTQARCDAVEELLRDWKPDGHSDVLGMIQRYARSFTSAPPAAASG